MHLQRWITGLILGPSLILLVVFSPPWLFLLFIILVIFLSLREFFALILPEVSPGEKGAGFILGFLLAGSLSSREPSCFLFTILLAFFFISIRSLSRPEEFSARVEKVSKQLLGFFYLPFLLSHFVLMRNLERGRLWVLFTLVTVYFGDTLAFYVGRAWGKRKMAPQISPGKTVEGGLGAMAGSVAGAWVSKLIFFPSIPVLHVLILGAAVGVIGQLGDLWESLLKRSARVKDSGGMIPGHGGLLDRIDSLLFAAPLVYYYAWGMGIG